MTAYSVLESVGYQEVCVWLGDCVQLETRVVVTVSGKSRYSNTIYMEVCDFHLKSCISYDCGAEQAYLVMSTGQFSICDRHCTYCNVLCEF